MSLDAARLMLSSGIVSESDLGRALGVQAARGGSLPRVCHDIGILDEARWARVVARALSLPSVDLTQIDVEPEARSKVPDRLLREVLAFPFQLRDGGRTLVVAMAEPEDDAARAQLKAESGCELKIGVAGYRQIEQMLQKHPNPNSPSGVSAFLAAGKEGEVDYDTHELGADDSLEPLETEEAAFVEADLVTGDEITDLTDEEQRLLRALQQNAVQGAKALRAAVDLCVERGLFTPNELTQKQKK